MCVCRHETYVLSQPAATVLKKVVIDKERIVNPLVPVLQEATMEQSFADLRMHLPEGLCDEDLLTVVQDMALPRVSKDAGVTVLSHGEILFVSTAMIQSISTKLLPPMIEAFAKKEAEKIDRSDLMEDLDTAASPSGKKGKSSKKSATSNRPKPAGSQAPLHVVANAILDAYPDLADIQESYGPLVANADKIPLWEIEDENDTETGGPILDICRQTLYTSAFRDSCHLAVHAELERLRSTKKASSVLSRKDGAAKIRSVESSFEESFAGACHQLLLHSKLLDFVDASDADVDTEILRNDFLRSNAADFASRITQYSLFKNELEGDVFSFHSDILDEEPAVGSPSYCQPINRGLRRFPHPYLSCIVDDDGNQHKPLPTLRKVLSGSLGIALARLWSHCGGASYDGGVGVNEDGTDYVKPGNTNEFMCFVEEHCLSICGMPYTKLNKKTEKQYIFARRQELTAALEATSDPADVLELSIMLLFQQLRGLIVAGPHLKGPILQLLCQEKKLPEPVAALLRELAEQCQQDVTVDEALVAKMKTCGLSRDITKHDVE
jgi:hypothetical protein